MKDKVKEFCTNVGALVEVWTVIYTQFINHGYSAKDALAHTESFMRATIIPLSGANNQNKEDQ